MKEDLRILIAYDESECARAVLTDLKQAGLPKKVHAHVLSVYAEWMPAPGSIGMVETNFTQYLEQGAKETLAMLGARAPC